MKKLIMASGFLGLLPLIGFAHEGHGTTGGYTITHYFTEPEHALFSWSMVALLGATLYARSVYKKRRQS